MCVWCGREHRGILLLGVGAFRLTIQANAHMFCPDPTTVQGIGRVEISRRVLRRGGSRKQGGGLLSPDDDDFSGVTVGDMEKVGGANPKFIGEPTSWWRSDSPARARNGSKGSQAGTLARTAQPGTHALRCQRELVVKKPGPSGVRAMPGSGRRRAEKTSGGSGSGALPPKPPTARS